MCMRVDRANYGLSGERTAEEARRMKRGASKFFKNITEILAKVPPPLLLLFKTKYVWWHLGVHAVVRLRTRSLMVCLCIMCVVVICCGRSTPIWVPASIRLW